jgi:hypothetical protein
MLERHSLLEELLRRMRVFTAHRRLYEERDEPFRTATVLSQLTRWLYVHAEEGDGRSKIALTADKKRSPLGGAHSTASMIYLRLAGKAQVLLNSQRITVTLSMRLVPGHDGAPSEIEEPMLAVGDEVQLEGGTYTITQVDGRTATLDRPYAWPTEPAGCARQENASVWLMVVQRAAKPDRDMQLMMLDLQGGAIITNAIKLLALPICLEVQLKDLKTRDVMCAVYRLLKAFCTQFPSGQALLAPEVGKQNRSHPK